jgi:small-conductance mechanosensitive channel
MKLIPDYTQAHKFWSVQLGVAAGVCGVLGVVLPIWVDYIPPQVYSALAAIAATGAVIGRVLQQGAPKDAE